MCLRRLLVLLRLPGLRRLCNRSTTRWITLVIGLTLIPAWQWWVYSHRIQLDASYAITCSTGFHSQSDFAYFLYYLNLFPVTTVRPLSTYEGKLDGESLYSKRGAEQIIARFSSDLVMEVEHTIRYGDYGKTFLFLPNAWVRGTPRNPSIIPFHSASFTLALMTVFIAFWWARWLPLGCIIVLVFGSNPFQLYEVYGRENIFSWPMTVLLLLLALHLPLLFRRQIPAWLCFFLPVMSGLILSSVRQIRSEPVVLIASVVFCYVTSTHIRWRMKAIYLATLAAFFYGGGYCWQTYFHYKIKESTDLVRRLGGHPYLGHVDQYHQFWHPMFCGLGDFDTKYGYKWDDYTMVKHILPILRDRYGETFGNDYWDEAALYYKTPFELPHYEKATRDKFLYDVRHDPVWYISILCQRVRQVLTETTPTTIQGFGVTCFSGVDVSPWNTIAFGFILVLLIIGRCYGLVRIVVFALPVSFTALVVYSKGNACFYSCYHLILTSIALAWLCEFGYQLFKRARIIAKA